MCGVAVAVLGADRGTCHYPGSVTPTHVSSSVVRMAIFTRVPATLRRLKIAAGLLATGFVLHLFVHPLLQTQRRGRTVVLPEWHLRSLSNLMHNWEVKKDLDVKRRLAVPTKPRESDVAPCVTFIVPFSGRPVVTRALASIEAQTNGCWAVIMVITERIRPASTPADAHATARAEEVFTNVPPMYVDLPTKHIEDSRITFLSFQGTNKMNYGGFARNRAFNYVKGPWVGFLDDDDTVSPEYVQTVLDEGKQNPDASLLVFRMHCPGCYEPVLPPLAALDFKIDYVGISFAVKRSILKRTGNPGGIAFHPHCAEDFEFLHTARKQQLEIVIVPHIGYFVHGVQPDTMPTMQRAVVQWDAVKAKSTDQDVDPDERCAGQYAARKANIARGMPKFKFPWTKPEYLLMYFDETLKGLLASLNSASQMGCLDNWEHGEIDIDVEISFESRSQTSPGSQAPYIQIQMEQPSSGGKDTLFKDSYVEKLASALQVWEFAPSHLTLYRELGLEEGAQFYVPQWLMLAPPTTCLASRTTHTSSRKPATMFQHAPSPRCSYTSTKAIHNGFKGEHEIFEGKCLLVGGANCTEEDAHIWGQVVGLPVCPKPDILLFGAFADKRKVACRAIAAANKHHTVGCFAEVFGELKDELICKAEVVFVEHFFDGASLEVHRVNPLLQAGKAVVAVPSSDKIIQAEYSGAVVFAPSSGSLPETISEVLGGVVGLAEIEDRARTFASNRISDLTPLCYALQSLNGIVSKRKQDGTFGGNLMDYL